MLRSIRWRIALPFVALILLLMLGLTFCLTHLARQAQLDGLRSQLAVEARLLANDLGPQLAAGDMANLDALAKRWSDLTGARVTVIAADGTVVGESHADRTTMDNHSTRPEVQAALASGEGSSIRFSHTEGYDMMYVAVPIRAGGQDSGVARLSLSLAQVQAQVGRLRQGMLAVALPVTLLAALLAIVVAERITQPLRRLTRVAHRMAAGDLRARLSPVPADEVGELARAFNRMGDRLQEHMTVLGTERSRLAEVLEHMADGVIIASEEGHVRLLNPAAARVLGVSEKEALGRSLAQVTRHYRIVELCRRAAETGEEQTEAVEADRHGLFLQVVVTPIKEGDQRALLVILQDLTRIRRLETVRRDFVSNISHELRTPLASLKALVDTLRDGALDDPPAAERFLDRIEVEVDAMAQMVQELLELSRIESGQVPLLLRSVPLAEVILPAVERLRPQAERAGQTLIVEPLPDMVVLADAERVRQVVTNLVHNAVKFTPSGGQVAVSAQALGDEVVVSVRDTGVGIPAVDLPRIFERFYKARRTRSGGTGLGLAIAKHIVQGHGGRIWAESVEGSGSTFHFTLRSAKMPPDPS